MTDARRRELERGGDLESEARALVEAVRAGELVQADLDLAADLGDPRAVLATGRPERPLPALCADLAAGPRRIPAACALGELAFPAWCWPRQVAPMVGEWVGEGVEALRAARDRGAPVARERAWNAHEAASQRDGTLVELGALAARVVGLCCEAAGEGPRRGPTPAASLARAGRLAAGLLGEAEARGALARALLAPRLRPPLPPSPPGWCSEADHLRRRLDDGTTPRAGLELACAALHAAASGALGLAPPRLFDGAAWVGALDPAAPRTRELAVRLLLACGRRLVRADAASPAGRTVLAVARWCVAPEDERPAAAEAAAREASVVPFEGRAAEQEAGHDLFLREEPPPLELLQLAARACAATSAAARDLLEAGRGRIAEHDLSEGLDDVVPWLFGYRDVVVELLER